MISDDELMRTYCRGWDENLKQRLKMDPPKSVMADSTAGLRAIADAAKDDLIDELVILVSRAGHTARFTPDFISEMLLARRSNSLASQAKKDLPWPSASISTMRVVYDRNNNPIPGLLARADGVVVYFGGKGGGHHGGDGQ